MRLKLLAVLLSVVCANAFGAVADEVKALMEQNKFSEAYQLGKKNPDALGDPHFDFYFGIAALDANAPGEGVLALERFLLKFPDNHSARFHLARGYYILGEDQTARSEFSGLLATAPATERDAINKYLDAIRARESRYTPTATFFAEAGLGYDSNINAGVNAGQVAGLTGFTVLPGSTQAKAADWFRTLSLGVQGTHPLQPGVSLYGGAQMGGRWYNSNANDIFDLRNINVQGGISLLKGRNLFRLGGDYAWLEVDNQSYLGITSLTADWTHQADQFNRFGLAAQWSKLDYQDITVFTDKAKTNRTQSAADLRSSDLQMLNGSWVRSFAHPWNPVLSGGLNFGQERNDHDLNYLSRDIYGARVNVTAQPAAKWSVNLGLGFQRSQYDGKHPTTILKRKDDYASTDFSLIYAVDRNWSVRGEYSFINQSSNIGLYDYDRQVVAAKIRYDFK